MQQLRYELDADGIALITWDMAGRSMNVLNSESLREFGEAVDRALRDTNVQGVIVTSGKPSFIAGADLEWLAEIQARHAGAPSKAALLAELMRVQQLYRRIETGRKAFVAAINGTALGGGFELCLACHHRVAADLKGAQLGLPEAKVGLMPGSGGIQRTVRMLGPLEALPLLLEGRAMSPREAHKIGLVDAVVAADDLIAAARKWLRAATPDAVVKPWDKPGFAMPGADPRTFAGGLAFASANALHRKSTYNNYPQLNAIQMAVYDGLFVPMDTALKIETRYFTKVLLDPIAKAMLRTQFINLQNANKLPLRPASVPRRKIARVGVLGAGLMGSGIAHVSARAGIGVTLLDVAEEAADRAKLRIKALEDRDVASGRVSSGESEKVLAAIETTADFEKLRGAELVIEAVFENRDIKADVTRKAQAVVGDAALFASNTSTLPITGLAKASRDPGNFIGLHFFSPVQRMRLVEVIRGKESGEVALAQALDYVRQIGKTPIVVNDSRGFYTSRVFMTYTYEGLHMLSEGLAPALIENAGRAVGMPMPPLALCDEVGLDLMHSVTTQTRKDLGSAFKEIDADRIVAEIVEKRGRPCRKGGKGFYDYPADGRKALWPEIGELAARANSQADFEELKSRFLSIQGLEAARCLEENVVTRPEDADIGATLGWGFAPWTGGPLSYIDIIGPARFVAQCERLADRYGERFRPNALLRKLAAEGKLLYEAGGVSVAA